MVGAFEAVSVLFRRKNSLSIVAKIAREHDIFGTSNDLIINHNRPEPGTCGRAGAFTVKRMKVLSDNILPFTLWGKPKMGN
jgi:hypothetical protein